MIYYLVLNEWNYPFESGREFLGDFDTLEEAEQTCKEQYESEIDTFLEATNGEIYEPACGRLVGDTEDHFPNCNFKFESHTECIGYALHSSPDESEDFFFRSIIIKRIV